jgi:hypothetical protein
MRYWIPFFSDLGEMFENVCCGPDEEEKKPADPYDRSVKYPIGEPMLEYRPDMNVLLARSGEISLAAERLTPLERALRFTTPSSPGAVTRLTQVLGRSIVPDPGELPAAFEKAVMPQGAPLAEALRSPEPRHLINELIAERIEELRPQRDLSAIRDAVGERLAEVDTAFSDLRKDLKRRPMTSDLAAAPPMKKLATSVADSSKKLEKLNADLAARVEALLGRVEQLEKQLEKR